MQAKKAELSMFEEKTEGWNCKDNTGDPRRNKGGVLD